jgi:HMG (high mobility group) box
LDIFALLLANAKPSLDVISLPFGAFEWPTDRVSSNPPRQPRASPPSPVPPSALYSTSLLFPSIQQPSQNNQQSLPYVPDFQSQTQTNITPATTMNLPEVAQSATGRPKQHIPRPPNAFMLFRSWMVKHGPLPSDLKRRQQNLSQVAGNCWRRLNENERDLWREHAAIALQDHHKKYPMYKFSPTPKGAGRARKCKKMSKEPYEETEDEATKINRLAEMCCPELKGREPRPSRRSARTKFVGDVDFNSVSPSSFSSNSTPSATSSASSPVSYASPPYSTPSATSSASSPVSYASPIFFISPSTLISSAPSPASMDNAIPFPAFPMVQFPLVASTPAATNNLEASSSSNDFKFTSGGDLVNSQCRFGSNCKFHNFHFLCTRLSTAFDFQTSYEPASTNPSASGSCSFEAPPLSLLDESELPHGRDLVSSQCRFGSNYIQIS